MSEKCSNCKFWHVVGMIHDQGWVPPEPEIPGDPAPEVTSTYGECKGNFPFNSFKHFDYKRSFASWPLTHKDDFCGQHQDIPAEP